MSDGPKGIEIPMQKPDYAALSQDRGEQYELFNQMVSGRAVNENDPRINKLRGRVSAIQSRYQVSPEDAADMLASQLLIDKYNFNHLSLSEKVSQDPSLQPELDQNERFLKSALAVYEQTKRSLGITEGEAATQSRIERFRSEGEAGFYPKRIVEETVRIKRLRELLANATEDTPENAQVQKRLFDEIVYNAHANVFPPVNSAVDTLALLDEKKYGAQWRNCVALIIRKDGTLAPAGGFTDMDEPQSHTGPRETEEEMKVKVSDGAYIGIHSEPTRDARFTVVAPAMIAVADADPNDPNVLKAADDATDVIVVRLINDDGTLNKTFFQPGTYTDARGHTFTHKGFFAAHDKTLEMVEEYHRQYGEGLSLSETARKMATTYPQEWFSGYKEHKEGADNYTTTDIDGVRLLMTPNIKFSLEQTTRIFIEAGLHPDVAATRARHLVADAIKADILPLFPQPAVTTDCLILTGEKRDKILVERLPNGELRLPGSFYSPEHDDAGKSLYDFAARNVVEDKLRAHVASQLYLGPAGQFGDDPRFPRTSHIFAMTLEGGYVPNPDNLPNGTILVELSIWADESHTTLSPEITQGNWGFGHGRSIVEPLLPRLMHSPLAHSILTNSIGRANVSTMSQEKRGMPEGALIYNPTKPENFFDGLRSTVASAGIPTENFGIMPQTPLEKKTRKNMTEGQQFVVDLLKRIVEYNGNTPVSLNIHTLTDALRQSYIEHMTPGNDNFDPTWAIKIMPDLMTAVAFLQNKEGVEVTHNEGDDRVADQILVASAMQAIDDARAQNPKALSSDQTEAIGKAEVALRAIGMKRLVEIGVLEDFPQVEPMRVVPDQDNPGKYKVVGGPEIYDVTFNRQFATLVRDFHIESATSRTGISPLLSGEIDTDPTRKIVFVAGTTQKEDLFPGMQGSDVYRYTTPVEIDAIKTMVEAEIGKDEGFQFKKVVSLSMGAKYAGANNNWLADMEPYIRQQIAEGGVFLIGSTDSNLAGPLLTKIKELGGKTIGVVPEGPVVFPGYRQDNLEYQYPSAALPADITIVVQAGREYDGSESPYFVQIALTEALAEGRMLDIGMINGGKLTLLDEVARLLDAEARKPKSDFPELNSSLTLVKDAGRGSQLLSVLIERQRSTKGAGHEITVEELMADMESIVGENCDQEQRRKLLEEFGYREDDPDAVDKIRAFLKELKKDRPPFKVALSAAFRAYNEYIQRHQLADGAVQIVTTSQLKNRSSQEEALLS